MLANFTTPDGRVKAFSTQRKKMEAILRYVLKAFEPGQRYSEKEVKILIAVSDEFPPPLQVIFAGVLLLHLTRGC